MAALRTDDSVAQSLPGRVGFVVPSCYDSDPSKGMRNPLYDLVPRHLRRGENTSLCQSTTEFDASGCCASERYCCPNSRLYCPKTTLTPAARKPMPVRMPNHLHSGSVSSDRVRVQRGVGWSQAAPECHQKVAIAIMTPPGAALLRKRLRSRLAETLDSIACLRFFEGVSPPAGQSPLARNSGGGTASCDFAQLQATPVNTTSTDERRRRYAGVPTSFSAAAPGPAAPTASAAPATASALASPGVSAGIGDPPAEARSSTDQHGPFAESDVVRGEYVDHYFNLARKVVAELHWALAARVDWIHLMDPDLAFTIAPHELRARLLATHPEATPLILGDLLDCLTGANTMCHAHPFLGWAVADPFVRLPPIPMGGNGIAVNAAAVRRLLDDSSGAAAPPLLPVGATTFASAPRCMHPYGDRAIGLWAHERNITVGNASWAGRAHQVCRRLRTNHATRAGGRGGFTCLTGNKASYTLAKYRTSVACSCVPV